MFRTNETKLTGTSRIGVPHTRENIKHHDPVVGLGLRQSMIEVVSTNNQLQKKRTWASKPYKKQQFGLNLQDVPIRMKCKVPE
jgi:hypothetical protein